VLSFLYQDLDTPFMGSREIPNPDQRRTIQRSLVAQVDYGWTDRLATRFVLPARDIGISGRVEIDTAGIGDVEAWARWRLGDALARWSGVVSAGLALPTGREPEPSLADENAFFGAGNESLLLSAEAGRRVGDAGSLFILVAYRDPLGAASSGYRVSDDFAWTAAWSHAPADSRFGLVLGASGRHLGQDRENGALVESRGGRLQHLHAGLTLSAGDAGRVGFIAQYLVEQDVRGDQLLAEWNLIATYGLRWSRGDR